jgi:plasmid maintenance system antidote protein VapI
MIDARVNYEPNKANDLINKAEIIAGNKTELAERVGMTRQYLNAILRGDKKMSYGLQVMLEAIGNEQPRQ